MYAPLKVTTDYTLLKSLIKIDSLMSFLVKHEINACGICDENLSGSIDFYNKCLSNNIKPIIGLSVFINNLNIYLYAMNYQGYKNLIKINTIKETRELSFSDLSFLSFSIVLFWEELSSCDLSFSTFFVALFW